MFELDTQTRFFGTISKTSLKVKLFKDTFLKDCPDEECAEGVSLVATEGEASIVASKAPGGDAFISFSFFEMDAPATIFHAISVTAPGSAFTSDTTEAMVDGSAGAPFLQGSGEFSAPTSTTTGTE